MATDKYISLKKANDAPANEITGSNNGSFTVIGTRHTGRKARDCETITVSGQNVSKSHTILVHQAAAPEFVSAKQTEVAQESGNDIPSLREGQEVSIAGWSNSNKLYAEWIVNEKGFTTWNVNGNGYDDNNKLYPTPVLPQYFILDDWSSNVFVYFKSGNNVNDMETSSDSRIKVAGIKQQYKFCIKITVPANPDSNDTLTRKLKIVDDINKTSAIFTITQSAGESKLKVYLTEITLSANGDSFADGNSAVISVESNTTWTASVGTVPVS